QRRTALAYEPRILATLVEARLAAGDRPRAGALLAEAHASVAQGRGWRLRACDVALARVRVHAAGPGPDPAAVARPLDALEPLAAELGAAPSRRMAELARARLARGAP